MSTPAGRRFTIADAMALTAATAVGFAITAAAEPSSSRLVREVLRVLSGPGGWTVEVLVGVFVDLSVLLILCGLVPWTPTLAALRLCRPRPPWHVLGRRPGAMACFVAASVVAMAAVPVLATWMLTSPTNDFRRRVWWGCVLIGTSQAGVAVLWCWLTMALSGRWRPEPSWIDRAGRLLGAAWIAMLPLSGYAVISSCDF
jgi:hypothetical protein